MSHTGTNQNESFHNLSRCGLTLRSDLRQTPDLSAFELGITQQKD